VLANRRESPAPPPSASKATLVIVVTTVFIDFVGFSVLIPVLPVYATRLGASPFEVGLILTFYALAQLLFLPAWGWASDRIGRRPVILVSLIGTVASFALLAVSESVPMILTARALAGFFAAAVGTAQAVVTDVTHPEDRARGMGMVGAAIGASFLFGPAIGGILSSYAERLPFQAVCVLAAANLVFAWLRLPESRPAGLPTPPLSGLWRALVPTPLRLVAAVHDRRIGLFLYLFLHVFTAFAALEAMFALYVNHELAMTPAQTGYVFAWMGLFIVLTQGLLVGRLAQRVGELRLVVIGLVSLAVGLAALAIAPSAGWLYAASPLVAVGNGLAFPSFTSLYSKACAAGSAGELLGQSQAMATSGRILGPLWAGWTMQAIAPSAPFWIASGLMLLGLLVFLVARGTLLGTRAAAGHHAGSQA
jgi:MFS family permease